MGSSGKLTRSAEERKGQELLKGWVTGSKQHNCFIKMLLMISRVGYLCAFTRVSMRVRRCVPHAVANQRLSAFDDVSLDTPVVVPPFPEK